MRTAIRARTRKEAETNYHLLMGSSKDPRQVRYVAQPEHLYGMDFDKIEGPIFVSTILPEVLLNSRGLRSEVLDRWYGA